MILKKQSVPALTLCGAALLLLSACGNSARPESLNSRQQQDTSNTMSRHAPRQGTDSNGMMQSMSGMMGRMHAMKMTGNPDRDFAEMMIIHHQGAVDMAKAELASGHDTAIRAMASAIIAAQEGEIAQMRSIASALPAPGPHAVMDMDSDPLMQSMSSMMQASHAAQMTGNADKDFVLMMTPHHEGAVAMARVQLKQGRNPELRRMAQHMINDQTREIKQFKQWLAAHP